MCIPASFSPRRNSRLLRAANDPCIGFVLAVPLLPTCSMLLFRMDLETSANYWKTQLAAGRPINRVRVRRLLDLAGAKRRGFAISENIRRVLSQHNLETDPDFESAWIEALLYIRLKDLSAASNETGIEPSGMTVAFPTNASSVDEALDPGTEDLDNAVQESLQPPEPLDSPIGTPGVVEATSVPQTDAQARFASIPSANKGVVSVRLDDSMRAATTRMMLGGFSQLAIMQGDYKVIGMMSWESIAKRFLLGPPPQTVADCRTDAHVIDSDRSLYGGLETIERHGYVLVRSKEQKITGIVTANDLLSEFGRLSYAFMSIRTIELLLRNALCRHLTTDHFKHLEDHSRARNLADWEFLSFGECSRLLQREEIWNRLSLPVDKTLFQSSLEEIRMIRNEVMHFSADPLDETQLEMLQQTQAFMTDILST